MNFIDKVVLVTGGSSGIGAAIAKKFASHGAKVAIVGRNETRLKNVSEECEWNGSKPFVIIADVTKDDDVKKIVHSTIAHFGRLNILVNNAGIADNLSFLANGAIDVFDRVMAVNLRSAVYITHLAAPHLINTKGNIINISSIASKSIVAQGYFAYCASKAGLDHFSRCVAMELAAHGVRVNTVNPGPVATDIIENAGASAGEKKIVFDTLKKSTALKRIGEPDEIADLVLFVVSDQARSITGSSIFSDNGLLLKSIME